MKINSIQYSLKPSQKITFKTPDKRNVKCDILNISFGNNRIKHSKNFLEITKNDKDLRHFITQTCMNDQEGRFSKDLENFFCNVYELLKNDSQDKRNTLIASAIAIKTSFEYIGNYDGISPLFGCATALLEKGFSKNEVSRIFKPETFDPFKPFGFICMKELLNNECSFEDMNFFLSRYCIDKTTGNTDIERISDLVLLFNLMQVDNIFQADGLYALTLDQDEKFNAKKCAFLYDSVKLLFQYCEKDNKNSAYFITLQENKAKGMIISMLSTLIASNTLLNGEFDENSAKEAFKIWLDYIIQNKEEINDNLKVPIYFPKDEEVKEMTINEAKKISPQNAIYDSNLYKITAVIGNFGSDIIQ